MPARPSHRMPFAPSPRLAWSPRLMRISAVAAAIAVAAAAAPPTTDTAYSAGGYCSQSGPRLAFPSTLRPRFRSTPDTPRPGYLSWSRDPTFGTHVTRVADEGGVRHRYSSKAAWNADGSLLLLDYKDGSREVRDGRDFSVLRRNVNTASDFSWSNRRSRIGYAAGDDDRPQIRRYIVSRSGAFSLAHTSNMASLYGWSQMSLGGGQGSPSNGDDMAVMFKRRNGQWGVAVVDLTRTPARVVSQRVFGTSSRDLDDLIDNAGISQSGRWVSIAFGDNDGRERQGIWLYRRGLSDRSRVQVLRQEEHWDWARNQRGTDVFVYRAGSNDVRVPGVYGYNVAARHEKLLVHGLTDNVHISGRNVRRCGWVYVAASGRGSSAGYGSVFAVNLRRPRRVQYFAHTHHSRDLGYSSQVQASASPNGRRVIFASEWGGSQVHAYVAKR